MKFLLFSAINGIDEPNRVTGERPTQQQRFRRIVNEAVLADKLGFDAYGVGERHSASVINSSPPVLLSHIAALTTRIRLITTVTVLSLLDPVRVAEDYATLDHLAGGRLDLMIGKGGDADQFPIFGLTAEQARESLAERYELLRRLWAEDEVTWRGRFRPPLSKVTVQPRPFRRPIRVWHAGSSRLSTADTAARHGDALFSTAGGPNRQQYRAFFEHYRERWQFYGRDPGDAFTGISGGFLYLADTTEQAIKRFEPHYVNYLHTSVGLKNGSPYRNLREYVDSTPSLIGSPQDVIERILGYHADYGNEVINLLIDALAEPEQIEQLERFAAQVAPIVRSAVPNRLWDDTTPPSVTAASRRW
ncbi:LLM class flavin-dependent oxidoreductase [Dactylosporangium sp. NPDC051485]|uniref:LLM class flavin-dependent oxidoreductase n=1 Tax=Dactylosporangium sp. NPDC051485 TaxID=3154846 RepID=UPI00342D6F5B